MPSRESIPGSPQEWLARAKSNLARAKQEKPKETLWEDMCYDAQQAAEKAIKAVLLFKGVDFPYVHNLSLLITLLQENGISVNNSVTEASDLTDYAVWTRYPGNVEPVGEQEYQAAVKTAQAVVTWAESILRA